MSDTARAAGETHLRSDCESPGSNPARTQQLAEARDTFAHLIHAESGTVALTKNVSEGLNIIATAVDWQPGDNAVICSDVEHANNIYLWLALSRKGVNLRDIPSRGGVIDAEAMASAVDDRTRVVTASAVPFVPGFRTDLATIGRTARRAGALFLVDGVQACGVIDLDVVQGHVSALATSTSKGLLGVPGIGFLYVAPDWIERLEPAFVSRTSIDTRGGHYSEYEPGSTSLRTDAQRFECGALNHTGAVIALAAMQELLAVGIPVIEDRAVGLASALADGLAAQGWPVLSPPSGMRRTHLVTVGKRGPGGPDSTGDPKLDKLAAALRETGVTLAIRRGLLRFGFHFYNDESDVEHVLGVARSQS
jgi:selenocysteine lyase/cysteine desulfurase